MRRFLIGGASVALVTLASSTASADLSSAAVDRFGDGDTIARFEQTHHGLPVIGHGTSVRKDKSGRIVATYSSLASDLPSTIPTVTEAEAARIGSRMPADAHLVIWPTRDRGMRLAYAVLPHIPRGLATAPRIIVDAQTGEVLEARDMVVFANVRVFEFNPVKTPTVGTFPLALAPTGGYLSNPFLESSNCIDKKTVKPVNMFGFDMNLHVCDLVQVAKADQNGDFLSDPADDPGSVASKKDDFAEASIYYHASKAYTFFRTLQGDAEAQVVEDKPLRVVANLQIPDGVAAGNLQKASDPDIALQPFQNAFFSPAGGGLGQLFQQLYGWDHGALWFGQGPQRDYAYDGDVVYHEFTHGVVDKTLKLAAWHLDKFGAIDSPGAMNEGLADYFSSAITGDPDVGEYASKDFAAGAAAIRSLANDDKCPTKIVGEVHFDSTLFSGGLWEARMSLPEGDRSKFDGALYKAMRLNPNKADIGYEDLAQLFLDTLKTDLPAGATALETAMKSRGVLPGCERILSFDGKAVSSPDKSIGFVAPGIQSIALKGIAPGILQIKAQLPPGATAITVSFDARENGGGPQAALGGQSTPFTPVVLAKIGMPITWSATAKKPHDAEYKIDAAGAKTAKTARIEIPLITDDDGKVSTDPQTLYLQIANTGDSDGSYDNVNLTYETADLGDGDHPSETVPTAQPSDDSGCACTVPGTTSKRPLSGIAGMFAAALALGALGRRRRQRS